MQVQWAAVPCNLGIGVGWASDDEPDYHLLGQPDGPIHFAGKNISAMSAPWQERRSAPPTAPSSCWIAQHRKGRPVTAQRVI